MAHSKSQATGESLLHCPATELGGARPVRGAKSQKQAEKRPRAARLGQQQQTGERRKRLAANARERKRMNLLNKAYDELRSRLADAENKSKYDVLVQAKEYIQALTRICQTFDQDTNSMAASTSAQPPSQLPGLQIDTSSHSHGQCLDPHQSSVSPALTSASGQYVATPTCSTTSIGSMSSSCNSNPFVHSPASSLMMVPEQPPSDDGQQAACRASSQFTLVKQEPDHWQCHQHQSGPPVAQTASTNQSLLCPKQFYSYHQQLIYDQLRHQTLSSTSTIPPKHHQNYLALGNRPQTAIQ